MCALPIFRFATVESVTAVDDHTVEIALTEPTPNMLDNVGSFKGMAILPEGAADDLDLATEANGTGPFELESSAADGITLSAFEDHWSGAPSVSGRSEEHTSDLQSLMRISYAVFCL